MTGESEVYLIDSSILNDLDNGEILEELADLPYHFYCTDFVEMEFKPRSGHHLPSNILS